VSKRVVFQSTNQAFPIVKPTIVPIASWRRMCHKFSLDRCINRLSSHNLCGYIYKLAVKIINNTMLSLNNDSHGGKGQRTLIYRTLYFFLGNEVSRKKGISGVMGEE